MHRPFALAACLAFLLPSIACQGFELDPVSAGARATFSNEHVFGAVQTESFHEYGVWAALRLPWQHYGDSGWGAGTRLLASAGVLGGGGQHALALSVLPLLALGSRSGPDAGIYGHDTVGADMHTLELSYRF